MNTAQELRGELADLVAEGVDDVWARAVRAVPREVFVPAYFEEVAGSAPTRFRAVRGGDQGWLAGVYADRTLVTQLDGRVRARDGGDGDMAGAPTSSSTLPSLVVRMWRQLDVRPGQRVLEVGTGTGYSTALGAHVLGETAVTSVEYDPDVAAAAAAALAEAGYAPRLVVGDGLRGDPGGGTYDRLIATCAVRYVPLAWLHQVRPGGRILATLSGWGYASALVLLTVTGGGTAEGRFLAGHTSFMPARPHERPPRPVLQLLPGEQRPSRIDPAAISDWTGGWVAQLAVPQAERMGAGPEQVLWDVGTGSQARTAPDGAGGWTVVQRGPVRLWDAVEAAVLRWQEAGAPHQEGFGLTIGADGTQRVWLGAEDGPAWDLPV